uniref:hypothetical protein n=1 Tax=Yersinia pestis TaxID=632 RepID=UPI0035C8C859
MSAKTNAKKKEQDKPQSSGLGLDGLGDLAGLLNEQPAANAGGAGPQELPLDLIDEDPNQPRTADNPGFSPESIAEVNTPAPQVSARQGPCQQAYPQLLWIKPAGSSA